MTPDALTDGDRAELLGWMALRNASASDAVAHFFPALVGPERSRLCARLRQWALRARQAGSAVAPRVQQEPARPAASPNRDDDRPRQVDVAPDRPPADVARPQLARAAFLEWQLGELLADLAWARAQGNLRAVQGIDARVSEVRQQLDDARLAAGAVVRIERDPATVAAEAQKQRRALELLAAAKARKERDL